LIFLEKSLGLFLRPFIGKVLFFCPAFVKKLRRIYAEVAHLVEHDLAKVGVAGSSPVFRSEILSLKRGDFLFVETQKFVETKYFASLRSPGGGIGRHAGLKILFAAMRVSVQLRSGAHKTS
jgi:hypothetical protein